MQSPHPTGRDRAPRFWPRILIGIGLGAAAVAAVLLVAATVIIHDIEQHLPPLPDPAKIATSTVVVDRDNRLLRPFTIADGRWRLPVTRREVDPRLIAMLIGYEDRRFAEHDGVDYRALLRAAGQFVLAGGQIVSGGSTLTMQVARLVDGEPTRSATAKLRQILFARALEKRLSKDEILDLYLMLAPYGGNIEGVRAASLAYFGKEPTRLTIAEAALLVALPQSPEARRPDHDAAAAEAARNRVLDRLASRRRDRRRCGGSSQERAGAFGAAAVPQARPASRRAGGRRPSRPASPPADHRPRPPGFAGDARCRARRQARAQAFDRHRRRRPPVGRDPRLGGLAPACSRTAAPAMST